MTERKQILLQFEFVDALTGARIQGAMTEEQWDNLSQKMESAVAAYYRDKGPKKDLN